MSTTPNPLLQPTMTQQAQQQGPPQGPPLTPPSPPPPPVLQKPSGFFSKIGAVLKTIAPYIQPVADHLAAVAGNYEPLELARQQRQDALQQQLRQSQMANQDLTRQLTQQQIDNYQTPDQQSARALALSRAEKSTTYQTDDGQVGIADTDLKGISTPRIVRAVFYELLTLCAVSDFPGVRGGATAVARLRRA